MNITLIEIGIFGVFVWCCTWLQCEFLCICVDLGFSYGVHICGDREACIFAPVLEEQEPPTLTNLLVFMLQSKFVWTLKNVCIFTLQVNCIWWALISLNHSQSWLSKSRFGSYDPTILRSHLPKTIWIFQGSLRLFKIGRIVRF